MATTFAVPDGRVAMAATLYTGNGSSNTISNIVNTVGLQPDLLWTKARSTGAFHYLQDSVRGVNKALFSNATDAEYAITPTTTTLNTTGFAFNGAESGLNANAATFVAWQWKAGGTAVSNTAGTITSSVSANPTAGFSVVTYTGNLSAVGTATVGHGLGVAPAMIITKARSATSFWNVSHVSLTTPSYLCFLNTTEAALNSAANGTIVAPTSTVFTTNFTTGMNISGVTQVAYCWAPVAGYSAFGSYTGNGSADGPFIYTGFKPRFLMIKSSSGAFNWFIEDSSRNTTNVTGLDLSPNLSGAEANNSPTFDFLSNGFKLRNTYTSQNGSGTTYIYAAFAENPLKYSNAR